MKIEKIFLVDDEAIINAIQTRMVKDEFPDIEIVRYGMAKELITVIRNIKFNTLIFLDLNMPGMDAIDFLKEIDSQPIKVKPIIFILTYSSNPKEIEFVKNHPLVYDVIFKPLNKQKINAVKTIVIN